jgi:hypothetical protein
MLRLVVACGGFSFWDVDFGVWAVFSLYVVVGCGLEDDTAEKIAQSSSLSSSSSLALIEDGAVYADPPTPISLFFLPNTGKELSSQPNILICY